MVEGLCDPGGDVSRGELAPEEPPDEGVERARPDRLAHLHRTPDREQEKRRAQVFPYLFFPFSFCVCVWVGGWFLPPRFLPLTPRGRFESRRPCGGGRAGDREPPRPADACCPGPTCPVSRCV